MDTLFELFLAIVGAMIGISLLVIGIIYIINRAVVFIKDERVSRKESLETSIGIFALIIIMISILVFIL